MNNLDLKVFLSHSSKDRQYVEQVFANLGQDKAFIDQYAFDDGADINDEIQRSLEGSQVFCLFLSRNSIQSKWVKRESRLARALAEAKKKVSFLIYIIDDLSVEECPKWISDKYIIRAARNPDLVAKRIRRSVLERSAFPVAGSSAFVNRREEIARLERILGLAPSEQPKAVFVHGWEGMGRDRLLLRAVGEEHIARVNLRTAGGIIDLYREILILRDAPSTEALHEAELKFQALNSTQQASEIGKLIDAVLRDRFHLEITEQNSLFMENGAIVPWFGDAVSAVPKSSPFCVFVRARRRPHNPLPRWKIDEIRIGELRQQDMENLLGQLLNEEGVEFSSDKTSAAANALGGHPFSAHRFTTYAKKFGIDAALQNDAIMVQYRELMLVDALEEFNFQENEWKVLFVVSRFRVVDLPALSEYTAMPVSALLKSLEALINTGMLSNNGHQYSISAFVRDPLQRHKSWNVDASWAAAVDERVARAVETFIDEGIGSSALLENGIAANLRLGVRGGPLANLVLGSHLFRVAREQYDARHYDSALDLYSEALARRSTLALEAVSEALRFYGLCGARLGRNEVLESAIRQLNGLNMPTALRNADFLRGFRDRRAGKYREAFQYFEASLRHGEHPHTLREAAFCALKLGLIPQARALASRAIDYAPTNAYFLDIMCRVVLAEVVATRSRELEREYEAYYRRLARACRSTGDSFALLRELECAIAMSDRPRIAAAIPPLARSRRYDDNIAAAASGALILDSNISELIGRLKQDAYSTPWQRRDFQALQCLQSLNEGCIDDAVEWISKGDISVWTVESIGIDYENIYKKVVARARAGIVAGDHMSDATRYFLERAR